MRFTPQYADVSAPYNPGTRIQPHRLPYQHLGRYWHTQWQFGVYLRVWDAPRDRWLGRPQDPSQIGQRESVPLTLAVLQELCR